MVNNRNNDVEMNSLIGLTTQQRSNYCLLNTCFSVYRWFVGFLQSHNEFSMGDFVILLLIIPFYFCLI